MIGNWILPVIMMFRCAAAIKIAQAYLLQTFRYAAPLDHLFGNDGKMEKWKNGMMENRKASQSVAKCLYNYEDKVGFGGAAHRNMN